MGENKMENYEVAYATPAKQMIIKVESNQEGLTVEQAIELSAIKKHFPEIDLAVNKVGVFSKPCTLTTVLSAGERVEIYRPLIADPKEVRRKRAEAGKETKKGMREKA